MGGAICSNSLEIHKTRSSSCFSKSRFDRPGDTNCLFLETSPQICREVLTAASSGGGYRTGKQRGNERTHGHTPEETPNDIKPIATARLCSQTLKYTDGHGRRARRTLRGPDLPDLTWLLTRQPVARIEYHVCSARRNGGSRKKQIAGACHRAVPVPAAATSYSGSGSAFRDGDSSSSQQGIGSRSARRRGASNPRGGAPTSAPCHVFRPGQVELEKVAADARLPATLYVTADSGNNFCLRVCLGGCRCREAAPAVRRLRKEVRAPVIDAFPAG